MAMSPESMAKAQVLKTRRQSHPLQAFVEYIAKTQVLKAGDIAIEPSKLEFWLRFQPKPGACDLAIEPSTLEFGRCQIQNSSFEGSMARSPAPGFR